MKLVAFAIFVVFTYFLQIAIATNITTFTTITTTTATITTTESGDDFLVFNFNIFNQSQPQQPPSSVHRKNVRFNIPSSVQTDRRSVANSSKSSSAKGTNGTRVATVKQSSSNTFFSSLQSVLQSLTTDIEAKINGETELKEEKEKATPVNAVSTTPSSVSNTTAKASVQAEKSFEELQEVCEMLNGTFGICQPRMHCVMQEPEQRRFTVCEWDGAEKSAAAGVATGSIGDQLTRTPPARLCCPRVTVPLEQLKLQFEQWVAKTKAELYATGLPKKPDGRCGVVMAAPFGSFKAEQRKAKVNPLERAEKDDSEEEEEEFLRDIHSQQEVRIVKGRNAGLGEYPWMVAIFFRAQFICGGSILSDRLVITAAHCFSSSRNAKEYSIRYESVHMYNGTELPVASLRIHEEYHPPAIYNDIALVFLEKPIIFSDLVQPVCLPGKRMLNELMVGLMAHVVGYGDLSFGGAQASVLQEVDVKIINGSFCDRHYRRLVESGKKFRQGIGKTLICAGWQEGGKDACQGDSGGPLTVNYRGANYLIGLVSFGYRCALPKFPGVYTAIAHYLKWIFANLQL